MNTIYLLSLAMVSAVCGSEKAPHTMYGILGDVMKEQLSVIKHCMVSRCTRNTGSSHRRFPGNVAFQAYPSSHLQNIPAKTKVIFDVATENIGHAYDPKTGVFTVPIEGVNVFHWTTMVHPGKNFPTNLKVNGDDKAYNHGYKRWGKEYYSPSQMFVGSLKKGDRVWLSTPNSVGQYLHRLYSTFSGFLL